MKTRQLGNLKVSELGAGAMSISANYGPPADRASKSYAKRIDEA
jgi:aryl-alcohol dehydrogenase-like predicted oxidoreductase